jgi:hypothetical protein
MFFLVYLWRELRRRAGRTAIVVLALAVATGLVVTVVGVAHGLDASQARVLRPLGGVGTDLVVSHDVTDQVRTAAAPAQGTAPAQAAQPADAAGIDQMWAENNAVAQTDLSKLGKPGDHFSHDFFLPGNQLTFPEADARELATVPDVAFSSIALSVVATHQEGTVPTIVASFVTGGQTIKIDAPIAPLSAAERAAMQACIVQLQATAPPVPTGTPGKVGPALLGQDDLVKCWPQRLLRYQATIVTPQVTVKQVVAPPQTDITSASFTVLGLDPAARIGPLSSAQVTRGRFFSAGLQADSEAIVSDAYAARRNLWPGSSVTYNGTDFRVVGIARPALGVQVADVYLTLPSLQRLAGREGRANMVFLRLRAGSDLDATIQRLRALRPELQVASDRELVHRVRGSLVDAAALGDRAALALATTVLAVAALLAGLLMLGAVSARIRELGTLKAIGWSRFMLVRQVVFEALLQSAAGAAAGIAIGIAAARALQELAPSLSASAPVVSASVAYFGAGDVASTAERTFTIPMSVSLEPATLLAAALLAVAAGLLAGCGAAIAAARLQPMMALRELN